MVGLVREYCTHMIMEEVPEKRWLEIQQTLEKVRQEIARVIVGQEKVVEQMLAALLCGGHCLLVGVPGVAKTLLVSTLGRVLGLDFRRIQFTPDLMPLDIVGSEILQRSTEGNRYFEFTRGPVFTHLLLADEINRTPLRPRLLCLRLCRKSR